MIVHGLRPVRGHIPVTSDGQKGRILFEVVGVGCYDPATDELSIEWPYKEVSPALQILIDAEIIDVTEDGREYARGSDDFVFELNGPWQGSDYSGDDVTESNQRSLARDYPQYLNDGTKYWGHCGYGLQIEPDVWSEPDNQEELTELANILVELKYDYPLYDEQDNGELIHERATASWDQYVRMDLESEVQKLTGAYVDLSEREDTFWELVSDHDIWPEAEGRRDVILRGIHDRDFLIGLADAALRGGGIEPEDLSDLTSVGYEILGAYVFEDFRHGFLWSGQQVIPGL
jgi:hypothetical protein